MHTNATQKPLYKPALIGFGFILLAIIAAMIAPLGSRIGWWDYDGAVAILQWAAYGGIAAGVLCLSGLFMAYPGSQRRGFVYSLLGLIIIVPMLVFLQSWHDAKQNLPPIQDITTDTENPPSFWYAPNSQEYGGVGVAAYQEEAYPDIQPLIVPIDNNKAFDLSVKALKELGWQLYEPNRIDMHIEATETTFWFGFSDDVSIHITPSDDGGSRIDVRSTSRFGGGGDGGTNANRIRRFFKAFKKQMAEG